MIELSIEHITPKQFHGTGHNMDFNPSPRLNLVVLLDMLLSGLGD